MPRTRLLVPLGLALAAGALAPALAGAATAPQTPQDKALFAYASCMRGKSVQIPDPVLVNGRYTFPKVSSSVTGAAGVRAKAQACAAQVGLGGGRGQGGRTFGGPRTPLTPAQQAQMQKFQDCLAKNGVTFGFGRRPGGTNPGDGKPPATGTPPANGRRPGGGGFNNPAFQKAFAACKSLAPKGFGQRFGGPGGPPNPAGGNA